jgi:hypothetical protein
MNSIGFVVADEASVNLANVSPAGIVTVAGSVANDVLVLKLTT